MFVYIHTNNVAFVREGDFGTITACGHKYKTICHMGPEIKKTIDFYIII